MPPTTFQVSARGLTNGAGTLEVEGFRTPIPFSAPVEFGGLAGLWTPEHLLLGAVTSCFTMTFHAIARISKLRFESFEVSIEGTVNKTEGGLQFTQIVLRPALKIADGRDVDRARTVLEKTGRSCLVSRSLSTPIHIEPRVEVVQAELEAAAALPRDGVRSGN
jgi:peroxiredoxin-like protein